MKVIVGPRRSGRSTELLKWLLGGPNRLAVFRDRRTADVAARWAQVNRMPLQDWQFISFDQLLDERSRMGRLVEGLAVDDLDDCLAHLFHQRVSLATVLGPSVTQCVEVSSDAPRQIEAPGAPEDPAGNQS